MTSEGRTSLLSGVGTNDYRAFELLAKSMLVQIAQDITGARPQTPIYYGNPDGGIEAKVRAGERTIAVQAKHYKSLPSEIREVKSSFRRMLGQAEHSDVTDFVWCSTHERTVNTRKKVDDARTVLVEEAATQGRPVGVEFWSQERMLTRLLETNPEAFAVWTGTFELTLRALLDRAKACARLISERIETPGPAEAITFRSELDDFLLGLDDPGIARRELDGLREELADFVRQLAALAEGAEHQVAAEPIAACADARPRLDQRLRECAQLTDAALPASTDTWPSLPRRETAEAARDALDELHRAIMACRDHLLDACDAYIEAFKAASEVSEEMHFRERAREAVVLSRVATDVRQRTAQILTRLRAEASGVVVVSGGWGTGKSFHLGRFCAVRIGLELPTVLVAARDFGNEPWLDAVARMQGKPGRGRELLATLQRHALATDRRALIAIDGINEALRDHAVRLEELTTEVADFPQIMLVVTRRDDVSLRWHAAAESAWAVFEHQGVDPENAWRILRQELPLPPMAGMGIVSGFSPAGGLPALRRPLVLRIFARCLLARGADASVPVAPPQVGALLADWLALLESEYRPPGAGRGKEHHASPLIGLVVDAVAGLAAEGTASLAQVMRQLSATEGWDSASIAHAVNFLVDEGVLVYVDEKRGVRFTLQRIAEHHEALQLLRSPGELREAIDRDVGENRDVPGSLTLALAELAVAETGIELPRLYGRRPPAAVSIAFLASLRFRDTELISSDTERTAIRLLDEPWAAPLLWYAVAANASIAGHQLGSALAHATLSRFGARTRDLRWALPIRNLLEIDEAREDLGAAFVWMERALGDSSLRQEHVEDLALFLLWCTAPPVPRLRAASVRILATALLRSPGLADRIFDVAAASGDPSMVEGAWSATLGAVLRSASQETTRRLADAAARATGGFRSLPRHYRTLEIVYRLQQAVAASSSWAAEWRSTTSFRDLLRSVDDRPSSRRASWRLPSARRLPWSVLDARDIALFDDATHPLLHEYRARKLVRRLGYWGSVQRGDRSDPSLLTAERRDLLAKYADAARQDWLLRQAARHGITKERILINEQWQKPAQGEGFDIELGDHLELATDPSIPLMYSWQDSPDDVMPGAWWVPEAIAALANVASPVALPADTPELSVVVTDPDEDRWFILHGQLRVMVPSREHPSEWAAMLQPFEGMRYRGPSMVPAPKNKREVFVMAQAYLLDTQLAELSPETLITHAAAARDARIQRETDRSLFLGDELHATDQDDAETAPTAIEATFEHSSYVRSTWHDSSAVVPIREIRHTLGLRWSGYALDFHAGDRLVIHDPGIRTAERAACPLLIAEVGVRRLLSAGRTLLWRIEVTDRLPFLETPTYEYWYVMLADGGVRFLSRKLGRH